MGNYLRRICAIGALSVDEDEATWKRQVTSDDRCSGEQALYELVEVKITGCGGKLLQIYKAGGKEALKRALDDGLVARYLYDSGTKIGKEDIIQWAVSRGVSTG